MQENLTKWLHGNNKRADQRSLISAFVVYSMEIILAELATHKVSLFYLVYVAEQTGLIN